MKRLMECSSHSIGIDEVWRWPIAGPVTLWAVFCMAEFRNNRPDWAYLVTDSKQISASKRKILAQQILASPFILTALHSTNAHTIDRYGIVKAMRQSTIQVIDWIFLHLPVCSEPSIYLDGNTDFGLNKWIRRYRPKVKRSIQTIIKGDQKMRQIAAASIVAKVYRDEYMIALSKKKKYANYGFDCHKGYGTAHHKTMIEQHWLSDLHRKTYCTKFICNTN